MAPARRNVAGAVLLQQRDVLVAHHLGHAGVSMVTRVYGATRRASTSATNGS